MSKAKVPFVDLRRIHEPLFAGFLEDLQSSLERSSFTAGSATEAFEKAFAKEVGAKEAVLVNNGTSALIAALASQQFAPGLEVIVPVNTFIATVEAVQFCGLTPVLVDVDPENYLLDISLTLAAVTKKTACILPVNLYGRQFPVEKLRKLLRKKFPKTKIAILEDACQSHGAFLGEQPRLQGESAAYSFYPAKNLGALGEAGAVATNSVKQARWMRMFRSHGSEIKYEHEFIGLNLRVGEIEAKWLLRKLPHLKEYNRDRQNIAKLYESKLQGTRGVSLLPVIDDHSHVYHLFEIEVKKRKDLQAFLAERGIDSGLHYPRPLHQTKAFRGTVWAQKSFPVAEKLSKTLLSLPIFAGMTEKEVDLVVKAIREFYA